MPELPEIEIIRQIIEPQITGKKILHVKINNAQIIAHPDENSFIRSLTGQVVKDMTRRGKFLTIHFESGERLVLHLRMTGQLLVTKPSYPEEKHTHLIADLSNGSQMRYIDVRRFGRFWFLKTMEEDFFTGQNKLGIEPLSDKLTASYLQKVIGNRKKSIKDILNDQSVVAGIGNIYSDEILYEAYIHPKEKCCQLNMKGLGCLAEKIKEIILWGINTNKMTPEEYLAGKGKEYRNIKCLRVYGKEGQPCKRCHTTIEKIIMNGRSSYYCPFCQKKDLLQKHDDAKCLL